MQGFHEKYGKIIKERETRKIPSSPTNSTIKTIIKLILQYHREGVTERVELTISLEIRSLDISKNAIQSFNILEVQNLLLTCPALEQLSIAEITRTRPQAKPFSYFFFDLSSHFFFNFSETAFLPNAVPNLKVLNLSGKQFILN